MSEPFVGEIRMFAGNFAPRSWSFCDGQLLAVSQNDALFSLFGTIYGGDGRTTFGLPDLRGRIPIHAGSGPGLSTRRLGAKAGSENVSLDSNTVGAHSHGFLASTSAAGDGSPAGNTTATPSGANIYGTGAAVAMSGNSVAATGTGNPHTNLMPTLCVHFIVALFGVYPSRH
ncbi:phage tail protein [Thalassotalea atypica]|uniref:phage tail protein n=1 Tax=Thalassotalea atypica TaxID=2054316 RepID=UPI0025722487|nr:tail fiber protein [Thalassotalea atypica]